MDQSHTVRRGYDNVTESVFSTTEDIHHRLGNLRAVHDHIQKAKITIFMTVIHTCT